MEDLKWKLANKLVEKSDHFTLYQSLGGKIYARCGSSQPTNLKDWGAGAEPYIPNSIWIYDEKTKRQ